MPSAARHTIIGATKGRPPIIDYNEIHEHDSHEARLAKMEYYYAKKIGEDLVTKFPNRQWEVNVDIRNEMIVISCPSLSVIKGYYMPIRHDTLQVLQERARIAGAEILERYGVTRGRVSLETMESLSRGLRDEVQANKTDTAHETYK